MASAKLMASSDCAKITTHLEFKMSRVETEKFLSDLTTLIQSSAANTFHLQVERRGVSPPRGGTVPISKGDPVTIAIHEFP